MVYEGSEADSGKAYGCDEWPPQVNIYYANSRFKIKFSRVFVSEVGQIQILKKEGSWIPLWNQKMNTLLILCKMSIFEDKTLIPSTLITTKTTAATRVFFGRIRSSLHRIHPTISRVNWLWSTCSIASTGRPSPAPSWTARYFHHHR